MFERFHRDARVAVVLAQDAARETHAREITPGHLLVGVLQSAGRDLSNLLEQQGLTANGVRDRLIEADALTDEDAAALRSIGIDLDEVRDRITKTFGADAFRRDRGKRRRGKHLPFRRSTKKVLELALREAIAHKDNWIGCEHIVLGMLRGRDDIAAPLLTEHSDSHRLRAEVIALLEEAA